MTSRRDTGDIRIVEVGPRDGLQNVKSTVPTAIKIELIDRLQRAGLRSIEITSCVSPRAIPQLADNAAVLSHPNIQKLLVNSHGRVRAPVLVPNVKGLDTALKYHVKEVAVFVSASEGFSKANINCSVQQGLDRARAVAEIAAANQIAVRGYVSCIFACPYDGPTPFEAVLRCVRQLLEMGCYEISLGDTLGVGVPSQTIELVTNLIKEGIPVENLASHFHDTYGQALANIWASYERGIRTFDASVGGLGGCPYAPGAKGNVATEDVVYMFDNAGVKTGVDLRSLSSTGDWISTQLKKKNDSRAGSAIIAKSISSCKTQTQSPQSSLQWTAQPSTEGLEFLRSGTNLKIVLDNPRRGNTLTTTMISNLSDYLEAISRDHSVTRVIITGSGKYFCTGMDLGKNSSPVSQGQVVVNAQYDRLTKLFDQVSNLPQVTIACVQGPAFGGGVGLAFACDIRILAETASMTFSEVKLGLCPATISKVVIRELGVPFAREAMLSGRVLSPTELARIGAISRVVPSTENIANVLDQYLIFLKRSAPDASAMVKELVKLSLQGGSEQHEGIRRLFLRMMAADNPEAAFGLKEFQKGNKRVDWDEFCLKHQPLPAKL